MIKKNGHTYYYYYCNDCKITIKEKTIEEYFDTFIDELVEYDSVVNQFFLPMIKQKFDEPREELQKEIKKQNDRLERIRKAYISGAFDLKEYNAEKKIVDDTIAKLQDELNETENSEELNFTPQDILLKRDIDYINRVKLKDEYKKSTKTWKDYTREEKANLIMTYVDDIKLGIIHEYIYVGNVNFNFRESICKPYSAFDYIPDESSDSVIYMKEPIPIEIGVKLVKKAFYKTYVILFYYEVLKQYGISQKGSREALAHRLF